ncbi:MAG: DUF418 domain-containing protein [Bacteroidia bacterium]|nr:DUF418 domain-containing protein [Bacteroidia bacterium]
MKDNRIHSVDALRGFSLAGIVIVHIVENFIGSMPPADAMAAANQGILDSIVEGFIFLFLRGKFFALFSFLFGLSFFIQMDKANQKGLRFEGRFLWRLILLLIIGALHHMFYRGDILTIYALLGVFLIPFYKLKPKYILVVTGLLLLGAGRYVTFALFGSQSLFSGVEFTPDNPAIINYFNILKNGNLLEVFASNTQEGHLMKLDFQLGVFGRGYLTFAFFLLGLYAGKLKFFEAFRDYRKKLIEALYISIGLLLIAFVLMGYLFYLGNKEGGQGTPDFESWTTMFALSAYDLSNLFMTFIIVIGFLLFYMKPRGERFLNKFKAYGRMALTNYFAQTIIGTAILYGWGMGYIGELRNIYTFLIGLGIILLQMLFSSWWLSNFKYGPLEWLWRSLTYFKFFPFKKNQ